MGAMCWQARTGEIFKGFFARRLPGNIHAR
jgi:hypothetical protein